MDKPIIGIVPTIKNQENPYQDKSSFVNMYAEKILSSGGIPIGMLTRNVDEYLSICDGYLWPGGNRIEWSFLKIIEDTIKNGKTTLGVCLGMQTICTYFNVLEDMKQGEDFKTAYDLNKLSNPYLMPVSSSIHSHHILDRNESVERAKHDIEISEDSILFQIYKTQKRKVVSLHDYCVRRLTKDLLVSAKSSDNVIEAVEYTQNNCNIIGVQYHPEIEEDSSIFDYLISSCYQGRSRKRIKE